MEDTEDEGEVAGNMAEEEDAACHIGRIETPQTFYVTDVTN